MRSALLTMRPWVRDLWSGAFDTLRTDHNFHKAVSVSRALPCAHLSMVHSDWKE